MGPHAPRLTPKEIDLLHKIWLEFSEKLPNEELHHHDIVHFALDVLVQAMHTGEADQMVQQLREHLRTIGDCRHPSEGAHSKPESRAVPPRGAVELS